MSSCAVVAISPLVKHEVHAALADDFAHRGLRGLRHGLVGETVVEDVVLRAVEDVLNGELDIDDVLVVGEHQRFAQHLVALGTAIAHLDRARTPVRSTISWVSKGAGASAGRARWWRRTRRGSTTARWLRPPGTGRSPARPPAPAPQGTPKPATELLSEKPGAQGGCRHHCRRRSRHARAFAAEHAGGAG